jgi:thiamine biosynthesis protein ThiS
MNEEERTEMTTKKHEAPTAPAGQEDAQGDRTVEIQVNGEERRVAPGTTVAGLLEELDLHPRLVVVEYNREILDRTAHEGQALSEGDRLELVHFVGGG